jgi:threonine/homoserine/homoserine lactone efflux protein
MYGVCGLALGAAMMAALSSAGVGLLVRSSPPLFTVMKYCGVVYLFYLSYRSLRRQMPSNVSVSQVVAASTDGHGLLVRGVLLQTSNPKSLLFFLSVLPQVVESNSAAGTPISRLAVAIAIYCLAVLSIHAVYAGIAARARRWLMTPLAFRLLSRISALVFAGFGAAMLTLQI